MRTKPPVTARAQVQVLNLLRLAGWETTGLDLGGNPLTRATPGDEWNQPSQLLVELLNDLFLDVLGLDRQLDAGLFDRWLIRRVSDLQPPVSDPNSRLTHAVRVDFRIAGPGSNGQSARELAARLRDLVLDPGSDLHDRTEQEIPGAELDESHFEFSLAGDLAEWLAGLPLWLWVSIVAGFAVLSLGLTGWMVWFYPKANNSLVWLSLFAVADTATDFLFVDALDRAGPDYEWERNVAALFLLGPILVNGIASSAVLFWEQRRNPVSLFLLFLMGLWLL